MLGHHGDVFGYFMSNETPATTKKKVKLQIWIKWTQIHKSGMEINWVIPPIYMILGEIARERKQKHYPLVNQLFAIENGPVEIVDLPIKKH